MDVRIRPPCHPDLVAGIRHVNRVLEGGAGRSRVGAVVASVHTAGRHVTHVPLGVGDRRRARCGQQGQRRPGQAQAHDERGE